MNSKGETEKKQDGGGGEGEDKLSPLLTEQTVVTYVTVPPDGGWGWVVVFGSFFCNFFVDGMVYSAGVFLGPISQSLNVSKSQVTLIGSLLTGFCLMAGPFASALANRYGFRVVAILGSFMACISFVASSFVNSIELLWLFYGTLGGIGFGLIYVPAVITTGFYFERWRALATGIAVCGSGIGTFLIAPITQYLIDNFGWRGTILIQAGMIFNCAIFGALFRPLLPIQVTVPCDEDEGNNEGEDGEEHLTVTSNKLPLLMKIKHAREELKRADSKLSFDNEVSITAQPPKHIKKFLKAGHNMKYATVREVLNDSRETVQNLFQSNNSLHKARDVRNKGRFDIITYKDKKINGQIYASNKSNNSKGSKLSNDSIADFPDDALLAKHIYGDTHYRRSSVHRLAAAAAILEASDIRRNSISLRYHPRARTASESSTRSGVRSRRATISSGVRPFYRDDIFLQANPSRLPQYTEGSGPEYTMTVTRLPTFNDVLEEETSQCTLCPEAVQRTLATMLDISLLTSPTFLILCLSGFITMMGFMIPYMFLQDRALSAGMDPELAKWLLSTIGITNTFGRMACGIVTSLPKVNALVINNIALSVAGIATIFSGVSMSNNYQFGYAAVFGLATSAFASLRSILIVDLIGLEKLTNGFGLLLLFQGVAASIGSPIAGYFMELTGNHNITFFISGSLILLSGVICYPLNWINKWENEKNSRMEARNAIQDQVV
uniref:Major facilitator superfamily (MFS) profile domain-containing protein n=1 Tax=Graphocephala atropunctata TaxID=36148 RepID=A0A1B6LWP0_9HEMI